MPKIALTNELSEKLKMERLNNKITAVDLAKRLNISTGRLSNIENNKVKEIDFDLFNKIIKELIPENNRKDYIETLLNDTVVRFSKKDIDQQDWFTIFDLQLRKVPITNELVEWLKTTCENIPISPKEVIAIVNQNNIDNPDEEFINRFKKCKPNQLFIRHSDDGKIEQYIRFSLPLDFLDKIISGETKEVEYIFMEGIVNAFTRLPSCIYYGTERTKILQNHKFYTLKEKRKILDREYVIASPQNSISSLPPAETAYLEHKRNLIKHFDKYNDFDPNKANQRLKLLNNNLENDFGFTLAFCTLPLEKLKDIDRDTKLNFLKEIKDRIDTLADNAKAREKIEDYDI